MEKVETRGILEIGKKCHQNPENHRILALFGFLEFHFQVP
jgi:hypothetical protein